MRRRFLSFLFLSHSLFSCERTPPSDPAQLETWISQVVEPVNRHRGVKIDSLAPDIKAKVAQKATVRLQKYLKEMPYRTSGLQQPSETASVFFDNIQFWLNLRADGTQFPNLLVEAQNLGGFCRLGTEFENFALQIIEDKKCSTTAAINFLNEACIGTKDLDKLAIACISHMILPSLEQISLQDKVYLAWVVNERTKGNSASTPTVQLRKLFNTLKEQLNAQTTT